MSAKGGITKGKSHKEGGIPMEVKSTGQKVELEGGEGVINKRNMASEKTYEFEGEEKTICEIASDINSADGNGVKIDCDDITGKKYKYGMGGKTMINEDGTNIPKALREVFDDFDEDADPYHEAERLRGLALDRGYDFDYGLDGSPTEFWKLRDSMGRGGKLNSNQAKDLQDYGYVTIGGTTYYDWGVATNQKQFKATEKKARNEIREIEREAISRANNNREVSDSEVDEHLRRYTHFWWAKVGRYYYLLVNQFREFADGGEIKVGDKVVFNLTEYNVRDVSDDSSKIGETDGYGRMLLLSNGQWVNVGEVKKSESYAEGGKLEPTIEELKAREKQERKENERVLKNFKKSISTAFGGTDMPTDEETNSYIEEYTKQKHNRKARRKFEMGGMNYEPHNVYVEFDNLFTADIYTMSGKYSGETIFKPNKMYKMVFLNNQGNKSALQFPETDLYVLLPNSEFTITGFEERYANGGSITPYEKYNLDKNDKEIIEILRSGSSGAFSTTGKGYTTSQLENLLTFKGKNVVNQLTNTIISKVYGLMYKNHDVDTPIRNLFIFNVGTGKLLNQAPKTLEQIYITHSDTPTERIETEICFLNNFQDYGKRITEYMGKAQIFSDIDAFITTENEVNPKYDSVSSIVDIPKRKCIGVGIAEFSSKEKCMDFIEQSYNKCVNLHKTQYTTINEGITEDGNMTLIYTITRLK